MAEKTTTQQQFSADGHDQALKLVVSLNAEGTQKPNSETTNSNSECDKAVEVKEKAEQSSSSGTLQGEKKPKPTLEADTGKETPTDTKENADRDRHSASPPIRPNFTRADSYFEVDVKPGRPRVRRFRSLMDRNQAANPGACTH